MLCKNLENSPDPSGGYCYEPITYQSLSCYEENAYVGIIFSTDTRYSGNTMNITSKQFTCKVGNKNCDDAGLSPYRIIIYDSAGDECHFNYKKASSKPKSCEILMDVSSVELDIDVDSFPLNNGYTTFKGASRYYVVSASY